MCVWSVGHAPSFPPDQSWGVTGRAREGAASHWGTSGEACVHLFWASQLVKLVRRVPVS